MPDHVNLVKRKNDGTAPDIGDLVENFKSQSWSKSEYAVLDIIDSMGKCYCKQVNGGNWTGFIKTENLRLINKAEFRVTKVKQQYYVDRYIDSRYTFYDDYSGITLNGESKEGFTAKQTKTSKTKNVPIDKVMLIIDY